jgi:hypothetical protein
MTRALLIPVDSTPQPFEYDGLDGLQRAVCGYVDSASWVFDDPAVTVYVNDEGKFACEPNRAIRATREGTRWDGTHIHVGDLIDILFGPIVVTGFNPETGEDADLTDEQVKMVTERFGPNTIGSGLLATLGIRACA